MNGYWRSWSHTGFSGNHLKTKCLTILGHGSQRQRYGEEQYPKDNTRTAEERKTETAMA